MRAGDMDRRITIQYYTEESDEFGGQILTWHDLATVWAEVRQEGGREFFAQATIQSERKVIFRLRWIDGVSVLDRVSYDGRLHNIHQVKELGRQDGLEFHTTASG